MDRAPLPPHERSWRHPSEIAAEERAALQAETIPSSTRAVALTSGALGLLAVGFLVLVLSPRQHDAPVAISASTTPSVVAVAGAAGSAAVTLPAAVRGQAAVGRWRLPGALAIARESRTRVVLATPVGDGTRAVLTREAVGSVDDRDIEVRLLSGSVVDAEIVAVADELVVVAIAPSPSAHAIADAAPRARDVVTVLATPPVTVALADLDHLTVAEGTPVLDDDGDLVGLCSRTDGDETTVVTVSAELVGATSGDR